MSESVSTQAKKILAQAEAAQAGADNAALNRTLTAIQAVLGKPAGAMAHYVHGRILAMLGRDADALAAQERAIAVDAGFAEAHYSAGLLLAERGRAQEAIVHWEAAIAAQPRHVDALYNAGQYHYNQGQFERALAFWEAAQKEAQKDFEILKKLVQAQHALERYPAAAATLAALRAAWQGSADPQIRRLKEVVIDQLTLAGRRVLVFELLPPPTADLDYVYTFRVLNAEGRPLLTAQLESSAYGRERGVPYLLGMNTPSGHRALGPSFTQRPPYSEVKRLAVAALSRAL